MASYTIGPKIGLDGEADFRKSLNNINETLRTLDSELKKTSSQFENNANSEEALKAKNDVLNRSISEQEKKLTECKKALEYSKQEYGDNASQTQKWQRVVNNTETDLNKLKNEVEKNEKAIEEMTDAANKSDKALDNMGDAAKDAASKSEKLQKIGTGIKTGLKVAAGGLAAVTAVAGKLGEESIKAYSENEQLVGGVETLFKKSADTVKKYADNAYKTAGLSANEYMQTVTGFSASLLQGLGGDTEKAAEIANLAVTDMSDNANKMGTDIENIQDAYQGFAKQNYTMLDNLKLGYGGTKEEMIRLINDSGILGEKIDSLDNVSFDQIIQAIHAVQTNLGITGTTALEASTTIEGSANSMKTAWTDFLSGIADENQDPELLFSNLIDSVMTFGNNIIPVIETIINNISKISISDLQNLLNTALGALTNILPLLIDLGTDILLALVQGIIDNLPKLLDAALQTIIYLANALIDALPELIPAIVEVVLEMVEILTNPDTLEQLIMAALEIIVALAEGLIKALPKIINKVPIIISNIVKTLIKLLPQLIPVAIKLLSTLAQGLITHIGSLLKVVPKIISQLFSGFKNSDAGQRAREWGKDFIQNIIDGIKSMISSIGNAVSSVAEEITSFLHFSVPDKGPLVDTPKWMPDMIDVLVKGMKNNEYKLANAAHSLASTLNDEMQVNASVRNISSGSQTLNLTTPVYLDGRIISQNTQKHITQTQNAMQFARGVVNV